MLKRSFRHSKNRFLSNFYRFLAKSGKVTLFNKVLGNFSQIFSHFCENRSFLEIFSPGSVTSPPYDVNNNMLVNCFLCVLDINWEDQTPTGLPVYMFVPYIRRFENAKILVTVHNSNMVTYRYFRNGKALENFLLFDF